MIVSKSPRDLLHYSVFFFAHEGIFGLHGNEYSEFIVHKSNFRRQQIRNNERKPTKKKKMKNQKKKTNEKCFNKKSYVPLEFHI